MKRCRDCKQEKLTITIRGPFVTGPVCSACFGRRNREFSEALERMRPLFEELNRDHNRVQTLRDDEPRYFS